MSSGWYVVQTKVRKEITAGVAIASKGFDVYCPVRTADITHAGKRQRVERALYPRYIFVSADHPGLGAGAINFARGVAAKGLLCLQTGDASKPQIVSDRIIDGIRKREAVAKARAGEITSGYQPGDVFKLSVGPYADIELSYLGEDHGEVTAIMVLFGQSNVVSLPIEVLPPLPQR